MAPERLYIPDAPRYQDDTQRCCRYIVQAFIRHFLMSFSVLTAMATWLCQHLDMGWPSYSADPRLCAQVCSLAGVMMSAAEKSVANCSGVPNNAPIRSVYLAR